MGKRSKSVARPTAMQQLHTQLTAVTTQKPVDSIGRPRAAGRPLTRQQKRARKRRNIAAAASVQKRANMRQHQQANLGRRSSRRV